MNFAGVIPILPTPFHDDETLDLDSWRRLLEFMIAIGVDGVTILGVLGESNRLNDHEREQLIEAAVETVRRRVPIIVGTSHTGTHAAIYLSRRAQELGAECRHGHTGEGSGSERRSHRRALSPYRRGDFNSDRVAGSSQLRATSISRSTSFCACFGRCRRSSASRRKLSPPPRRFGNCVKDRRPLLSDSDRAGRALCAVSNWKRGLTGSTPVSHFQKSCRQWWPLRGDNDWQRVHDIYSRFAALIVSGAAVGVAIRKDCSGVRGLFESARVRHPGASISPTQSGSSIRFSLGRLPTPTLLARLLLIPCCSSRHSAGTAREAARLSQPH